METELGEQSIVALPDGPVRVYRRGSGPTIVFIHGMSVNAVAWRKVVPLLCDTFHCVTADWPFGAHQLAMSPAADLSAPGIADIVAATITALGLTDVTLVGNDGGGLLAQLVITRHPERIQRLVLTNCDAYENFPPPEFAYLCRLSRLPVPPRLVQTLLRTKVAAKIVARSRRGFAGLSTAPVDSHLVDHYLHGLRETAGIFTDFMKFLRSVDATQAMAAAERFGEVTQPVLIAWAPTDRFFPVHYAHRLAADFPDARLRLIDDSSTWVAEDQPVQLAELIREFLSCDPRHLL